jgi:hypothetical protein
MAMAHDLALAVETDRNRCTYVNCVQRLTTANRGVLRIQSALIRWKVVRVVYPLNSYRSENMAISVVKPLSEMVRRWVNKSGSQIIDGVIVPVVQPYMAIELTTLLADTLCNTRSRVAVVVVGSCMWMEITVPTEQCELFLSWMTLSINSTYVDLEQRLAFSKDPQYMTFTWPLYEVEISHRFFINPRIPYEIPEPAR